MQLLETLLPLLGPGISDFINYKVLKWHFKQTDTFKSLKIDLEKITQKSFDQIITVIRKKDISMHPELVNLLGILFGNNFSDVTDNDSLKKRDDRFVSIENNPLFILLKQNHVGNNVEFQKLLKEMDYKFGSFLDIMADQIFNYKNDANKRDLLISEKIRAMQWLKDNFDEFMQQIKKIIMMSLLDLGTPQLSEQDSEKLIRLGYQKINQANIVDNEFNDKVFEIIDKFFNEVIDRITWKH